MPNQYEVLGKAPDVKDLQNLSPSNVHLTIKNLNAGYGKMEILHNFCLLYTSPSPRDNRVSRMPSSA